MCFSLEVQLRIFICRQNEHREGYKHLREGRLNAVSHKKRPVGDRDGKGLYSADSKGPFSLSQAKKYETLPVAMGHGSLKQWRSDFGLQGTLQASREGCVLFSSM